MGGQPSESGELLMDTSHMQNSLGAPRRSWDASVTDRLGERQDASLAWTRGQKGSASGSKALQRHWI